MTTGGAAGSAWHRGRRRVVWGTILLAVVVGLTAEVVSFGMASPTNWLPDLAVGWVCIGFGLVAASRRPDSSVGLLLVVTGFAWFIGNYSAVAFEPIALVADQFWFVHRAVLLHAVLILPGGRIISRRQLGVIVVGYLAWSIPATATSVLATLILSALAVAVAAGDLRAAAPPARHIRATALAGVATLAAVFTSAAIVHQTVPDGSADLAVLLVYEAAIIVVAAGAGLATLLPRLQADRVTDLVVEASRSRSGLVRDALSAAVGDPSLEIGYWHRPSGAYLDAAGEPVEPPGESDRRVGMRIDAEGRPTAMLVHDPAVLESSALADAVRAATLLAAANARLRGDVLDRLTEVRASRRRLMLAADEERRRLERRINQGPLRRTKALASALADARIRAEDQPNDGVAERVAEARAALEQAIADLQALTQGLHPASIAADGLAASLRGLAGRMAIPTDVSCDISGLPEPVELALYYASAEALANVAKHARASRADVSIASDGSQVTLVVADDGSGGADPAAGSGLRGIGDRVAALGGRFSVASVPGSGTRLVAQIPL